jgi:UrcA family protein
MQGFELDFAPNPLRIRREIEPSDAPRRRRSQGSRFMKTLVASTAAFLLLTGASFASAATAESQTVSIPVSKAKLDLNTPRDAQRMMERIDSAALQACGADRRSLVYVQRAVAASACHHDAVAGAVAQLNSSQASLTVTGVRGR